MESKSRVCDIKKKFEHLNGDKQQEPGKCHIKRSNAFRADKPIPKKGAPDEVLKTPLPKGPPPKKPPRTFEHVVTRVVTPPKNVRVEVVRRPQALPPRNALPRPPEAPKTLKASLSAECPVPLARPPPPTRSKTESQIIVKKLNPSLLTSILNSLPQRKSPEKAKKADILCLTSFNCASSKSSQNIYDIPFEASLPDLVKKPETTLDFRYGQVHKSPEPIYSEPFAPHLRKNKKGENNINKFNTFNVGRKSTPKTAPLYYMSTPITQLNIQHSGSTSQVPEKKAVYADPKPKRTKVNESRQNVDLQKLQVMVKEVYGTLSIESPTESDIDNSNVEEQPKQNGVVYDDVTEKRKVYVRQMSSMRVPISPKSKMNYPNIADAILLIGLDSDPIKGKIPYVKFKFPQTFTTPMALEDLCFPDGSEWPPPEYPHSNYTVVLTSREAERKFVYCRRLQPEGESKCLPLAYCIITSNKSSGFYYKILSEIESIHGQSDNSFKLSIQKLYNLKFPKSGESVTWNGSMLKRPVDWRRESNDIVKMLKAITLPLFLQVFSSLLHERKIIIISSNISKLSDCIEGLQTSLFPFEWQHTVVTCLTCSLIDFVQAPTPYIVGVLTRDLDSLPLTPVDEVLVVDVDRKCILRKVGDEDSILPKKYGKCLIKALEIGLRCEETNFVASEALIRFFVMLVGHFRAHITTSMSDFSRQFQRDTFITSVKNRNVQLFLDWFTETAMFQIFMGTQLDRTHKPGIFEISCAKYFEELVSEKRVNGKRKVFT